MAQKRAHIIYSGTVQGIGFRWAAQAIADSIGLTGWVRNCPNGTVEIVSEGRKEDIEILMNKIENQMAGYIRSKNVEWKKATGKFDSFGIKLFD